jgi:NAD(P)-dependent dehydrogenase (short-subunit alcohol dehydrogenase family)
MTTILVTGATDGIGKETARILASEGHDVILHGRTLEKARAARMAVEQATGRKLPDAVAADLASLDEVRGLAVAVLKRGALDAIINNAGIYAKARTLTADGRELTMAVNHDAPFLLTHLLLDALAKSASGRVVNVSSIAHGRGRIDLADIDMVLKFDGYGAYASSKLANVLFTVELARRLKARKSRVLVNALHPGVVSTKLLKAGFNMHGPDSHEDGAATSVYLATAALDASGRYFVRCKEARASELASDPELCRAFYEASCARVGIAPL